MHAKFFCLLFHLEFDTIETSTQVKEKNDSS